MRRNPENEVIRNVLPGISIPDIEVKSGSYFLADGPLPIFSLISFEMKINIWMFIINLGSSD